MDSQPPAPAPDPLVVQLQRAEAAARDRRYGEADGICRDLLARRPGYVPATGLRGTVAAIVGDVPHAIELLQAALAAQAAAGRPLNIAWRSTLADMFRMSCRLDEALALGREVALERPRNPVFLVNLAKIHYDRAEWEQATTHFLAALSVEPENPNAHLGIGQILLAGGQFRPGWIEYEWRNDLEQAQGRMPPMKAPMWNGMSLPRGRVLLIGDQGFGDTLQFCRYVPMVAERCREVLVGCTEELRALMLSVAGVGRVFTAWREIPGFSAYTLMSSLPYVFGTDLATIPAAIPYMEPAPAKIAAWRERLSARGATGRGRAVGLFWSGRSSHPNNRRRSLSLRQLRPILRVPGLRFVSLQKDCPPDDLAERASLDCFDAELTDFEETAALMRNLDLVVTVDSAVGHLAGALGVPVWVMTPTPADWRWMLGRSDSPWYPTMRLFRQPVSGDWDFVIGEVTRALDRLN